MFVYTLSIDIHTHIQPAAPVSPPDAASVPPGSPSPPPGYLADTMTVLDSSPQKSLSLRSPALERRKRPGKKRLPAARTCTIAAAERMETRDGDGGVGEGETERHRTGGDTLHTHTRERGAHRQTDKRGQSPRKRQRDNGERGRGREGGMEWRGGGDG